MKDPDFLPELGSWQTMTTGERIKTVLGLFDFMFMAEGEMLVLVVAFWALLYFVF